MKTAGLVSSVAERLGPDLSDSEHHVRRLAGTLGITYRGIPESARRGLMDSNLIWVVGEEFVRKFKYAAGIDGGVYLEPDDHREYPSSNPIREIHYIGDIPEFALDSKVIASKCGLKFFTIHSVYPLPTRQIQKQVDPVMVGWFGDPRITFMDIDCLFFKRRGFHHMALTVSGIVVAIWDRDKEISVL